jgi:hypothetical protein
MGCIAAATDAPGLARAKLDLAELEHRVLGVGRSARAQHDPVADEQEARRAAGRHGACSRS